MNRPVVAIFLMVALLGEAWLLWRGAVIARPVDANGTGARNNRVGPGDNANSQNASSGPTTNSNTAPPGDSGNRPDPEEESLFGTYEATAEIDVDLKKEVIADPSRWASRALEISQIADDAKRAQQAKALIRALNFIDTEKLVAALPPVSQALGFLSSDIPEVRQVWAASSLVYDVPELRQEVVRLATDDSDMATRAFAIDVLGDYPSDPRIEEILIDAASSSDAGCRRSALDGFAKIGGPAVLPLLEKAAEDKNVQLRVTAWESLCARAKTDDVALDTIRRICKLEMPSVEAKILWTKLDQAKLLGRLSREDIVRLECLIHPR